MDDAVDTKDGTNRITYGDLIAHPEMKEGVAQMSRADRAALFREFIARNRLDDKNFFAATPNNWGWHLLDPARRECVALAPKDLHDFNRLAVDMLGVGIIEVIGAVPGVIEPSDFTTGQLRAMCALNPELMNESARSKYPVLQEIAGMPKIDVMDAFLTPRALDVEAAIARLPAAEGGEIAALEEWAAEKEAALDAAAVSTPDLWGDYVAVHDARGGLCETTGKELSRFITPEQFDSIVGDDADALDLVSGATGVRSEYAPFSMEQVASAIATGDESVIETMNAYAAAMCSHDGSATPRFHEVPFTPGMYSAKRLSNMLEWRPERLGIDQMRKWPALREAAPKFSMKAREFIMADWLRDVGTKVDAIASGRPGPACWGSQICFTETGYALTCEEFDAIVPPEHQQLYLAAESVTSRHARQQVIRDADDPAALAKAVGGPKAAPAFLRTVIEPTSYSESELEDVVTLRPDLADAESRAAYPELDRAARAVESREARLAGTREAARGNAVPERSYGSLRTLRPDRGDR